MKKWNREAIFSWYTWRFRDFNLVLISERNTWWLETLIGGELMACINSTLSSRFLQVIYQQLLLNICMDLLHFLLTLPLIIIPIKIFLYGHGANFYSKYPSLYVYIYMQAYTIICRSILCIRKGWGGGIWFLELALVLGLELACILSCYSLTNLLNLSSFKSQHLKFSSLIPPTFPFMLLDLYMHCASPL